MADERPRVIVEFYGVPRLRAGRAELPLVASTLRDALDAVAAACPGLGPVVTPDGRLSPHWLLCLDGQGFADDLDRPLHDGQRLLLLSADAGG
jgi:molybdopterin synthase sulfur carrier subunit